MELRSPTASYPEGVPISSFPKGLTIMPAVIHENLEYDMKNTV